MQCVVQFLYAGPKISQGRSGKLEIVLQWCIFPEKCSYKLAQMLTHIESGAFRQFEFPPLAMWGSHLTVQA